MSNIVRTWVETHTRADGSEFYTAHIRMRTRFLKFIPITYVEHVCCTQYGLYPWQKNFELTIKEKEVFNFSEKGEAEEVLVDIIHMILDRELENKNLKVVKRKKSYLNLFPTSKNASKE